MRPSRPVTVVVPLLVVGAAAAAAAELSASLLLYSGQGFLRAVTVVLAVQLSALGLGLLGSLGAARPLGLQGIWRRWLWLLVSYTLASGLAAANLVTPQWTATPLGQGIGLALMGALPLYMTGSVLGSISTNDQGATRVGPLAILGAAGGVVVTGMMLLAPVAPPTILVLAVVALSGAALLYGAGGVPLGPNDTVDEQAPGVGEGPGPEIQPELFDSQVEVTSDRPVEGL